MSIAEEIARLTGVLKFDVETAPLHKFLGVLKTAENAMARVGREASRLQAQLNKAFGVTSRGVGAEQIKLNAEIRRSLDKELATETKLSKLRRQQFAENLAQQRLIAAGTRQESWLQSAALKDQVQRAVAAAKLQKVQQETLKTKLGEAKLQGAAEQSALRQARFADILQKRQARTVQLQQQALLAQNKFQRAEAALNNARASGIRQAERYEASKVAAAVREARAAVKQDQATQRFTFATERHAAWKARQEAPKEMNFGSLAVGLSSASAALYGLVKGVSYLSERIQQRQESASTAESFNSALQSAGGKNPANQKFARDQFVDISNKYGMEVTAETAKSFALFIQGQLALGKTLTQATKMFEDQSATFRAAALDKEAQKRAAYQLNQIRAKGKPEGSDVNDLFDAVGGVVAASIRQAAATRLNFKGKVEEQAGWFKQAVTDGKIKAADFDQGMSNFLSANRDLLARQMNSIQANQQRAENQAYLNDNTVNSNAELKEVILDRIMAENELNTALQPLMNSLRDFDQGLTKFNTSLIRMLIGHDKDGNAVPNAMQKDPNALPGTVGAALGPRLKPAAPDEQARLDDRAQPGLLNGLRRLFTGTTIEDDQTAAQDNKERWKGGHIDPVQRESFDVFKLKLGQIASQFEEMPDESNQWSEFRVPQLLSAEQAIARATSVPSAHFPDNENSYNVQPQDSSSAAKGTVNATYNTIEPTTVNITVTPPPGMDTVQVANLVGEKFQDEMGKLLREVSVNQQEVQ